MQRFSWLLITTALGCGGHQPAVSSTVETRVTPAPAPTPTPALAPPAPAPPAPAPPKPLPIAWMRAAPGNNYLQAAAIRGDGTIVVGANDDGSGWLGKQSRKNAATGSVISLDATGKTQWVRPTGTADIRAVQALDDGGIVACGDFDHKLIVDGKTLATAKGHDLVVLALDGAGKVRWTFTTGGASCSDLAPLPSGKFAIVGSLGSETMFGDLPVHPIGNGDVFTAVLDSTGQPQWVAIGGSAELDDARAVSVTASAIYITGYFGANAKFGDRTIELARGPGSRVANPSNAFIARYRAATGELDWVASYGVANAFDRGWAVAATSDGAAIAGESGGHVFVAHYAADGHQTWVRTTTQDGAARGLIALPHDELVLAAYFGWPQAGQDLTFRGIKREITLTARGSDTALVRYSGTGELLAAGRLAGATPHSGDERTGSELEIFRLARDAHGRIIAAGRLWGSAAIEAGDLFAPSKLTAAVPDRGGVVVVIDPAP